MNRGAAGTSTIVVATKEENGWATGRSSRSMSQRNSYWKANVKRGEKRLGEKPLGDPINP